MHTAADYRRTHVEIDTQECELPDDERAYIQRDLDLLAADLLEFPQSQLLLKIVHHPNTQRYHAQAKLTLPGNTIITGRYSPWLDEALHKCLGRVRQRADQYKAGADPVALRQASRRKTTAVESVAAPTEPDASALARAAGQQDFRRFRLALANHESWLRSQVARWTLRYPQVNQLIGKAFDADDIVEEVFLMAFEEFADRPDEKSLSQWLGEFVDPAVRALWADPLEREAVSFARTISAPQRRRAD